MLLSSQNITTGDTRRYIIDYRNFLQFGETITGFTLAVAAQSPPATSTLPGNNFLDVDDTQLFFYVKGGVQNEQFVVNVQITTNYGETINDTIAFTVVAA